MMGAPACVISVLVDYCTILTAPITQGVSGKACGGQVRYWPGVIFLLAHLLKRNHLMGIFPMLLRGFPPASLHVCISGLRTSSM